jgi:molecular chaperone HscB
MTDSLQTATVTTAHEATQSCWSCGATAAAQFCKACGKVQPAAPVDYFTSFALPRKLNLDVAALEKDFYLLSRKLHPDVVAQGSRMEQEWSLQQSSLLNDAYRTLKDPVRRTEYLLRIEGVELEEQSKAATDEARNTGKVKKQIVPPDLLEEVFELNMQLEELRMQKKVGEDDPALLEEVGNEKLKLEQKHEALLHELKDRWKMWDGMIQREQNGQPVSEEERKQERDKMVDVLNRRNYIRNLVRDVNEAVGQ